MSIAEMNARFEETPPPFSLGSFVYQPYEPQKAAVVVGISIKQRRPETPKFYSYRCRRPDGSEFEADLLSDFRKLIADHERKLNTHRALLARLEQVEI